MNLLFIKAKLFGKLDAKAGYCMVGPSQRRFPVCNHVSYTFWQILLAKTPLWGECLARHIFQARMDHILEGLKGVSGIGDDVCVSVRTVRTTIGTLPN